MTRHSGPEHPADNTIPFPAEDPQVTAFLRARYASPGDPAYWSRLESAIVARAVGGAAPLEWWSVLGGWMRAGVLAAGLAAAVALAVAFQTQAQDTRVASEALLDGASAYATQTAPGGAPARDATLSFVISH